MPDRTTIYVAGYPKSGTTWLTWLLAATLNCPAGGSMPKEDKKELATEGLDRPGPYVVRKGHFVLMEGRFSNPVPTPHRLAPSALRTNKHKVVWITRDPRDVAVSAKNYFKNGSETVSTMLGHMTKGTGPFRAVGSLNHYVTSWLEYKETMMSKYEWLIDQPLLEVKRLLNNMDIPVPDDETILQAIRSQSFQQKKSIMQLGVRPNAAIGKNLLNVGRKGQWRYTFSSQDARQAALAFNPLMLRLGYIENGDWWKNA